MNFLLVRRALTSGTLAFLLLAVRGTVPAAADSCQFVLGFASIASMIPQNVGQCADNESHNPQNGDALQHTSTGGLLVWRKADNWTAFTDGFRSWINGPNGLQQRLNTQRFSWEANPEGLPLAGGPEPATASLAFKQYGVYSGQSGTSSGTFGSTLTGDYGAVIVSPLPDGRLYAYFAKVFVCDDGKTYQSVSGSSFGRYDQNSGTFTSGSVTGKLIDPSNLSVRVKTVVPGPSSNCSLDWNTSAKLLSSGQDALIREFIRLYNSENSQYGYTLSTNSQALDIMLGRCRTEKPLCAEFP